MESNFKALQQSIFLISLNPLSSKVFNFLSRKHRKKSLFFSVLFFSFCSSRLLDLARDPPGGGADLVVDPRLLLHGAPESGRGDPDERPAAVEVDDEWATGVSEASVPAPLAVSGAEHLVVQLH